jgi:hypothetical protein
MILFRRTTVHPRTTSKIVWLSGASDPFSSALSVPEERLLEHLLGHLLGPLELARGEVVWANFPYAGPTTRRRVPLPVAALSNVLQFLLASTPIYRWLAARHWRALCSSASSVLVVAGSCGAPLLRALEPATPVGVRVHALALGPVAWRAPRCLELALVGTRDGYSRAFTRAFPATQVVAVTGVDHMSYLESDEVQERVRDWIRARCAAQTNAGGVS